MLSKLFSLFTESNKKPIIVVHHSTETTSPEPTDDERRELIERYAAGTLQSEDSVGMEHDGLYPTSPGRLLEGNMPLSPGTNIGDVSPSRPLRCSDCGFHCETEQIFVAHCEEHSHEQHLMCGLCKRSFSKKQSLRRHMNLHSGHRPFKCPFCEYRSSRKDHLKLHMRTRHDPGQSKQFIYKCPVCSNSFPSQKRMVNHMKSHQQTIHRCDLCDATFPSSVAFDYHKKTKHVTIACAPATEGGPYQCPVCRCAFSSADDYAQHLQSQRHKDMVTASVRVPTIARRLLIGDSSQEQSLDMVTDAASMAAASAAAASAGIAGEELPSHQSLHARSPSHIQSTSDHQHNPNGTHPMPLSLVKIPAITVQTSSSTETDDGGCGGRDRSPSRHSHSPSPNPRKMLRETGKQSALPFVSGIMSLSSGSSGETTTAAGRASPRDICQLQVSHSTEGISVIGSDTASPAGYVPIPSVLTPQRCSSPAHGQLPSSRQESTASSASIGKLNGSHSFNSSFSINSSFRSSSIESHLSHLSSQLSSQLSTDALSDIMVGGNRMASQPPVMRDSSTQDTVWRCQYCHIVFPDNILFAIHMGCHDLRNPFRCNICSFQCQDRYEFTSHITRGLHDTEH